MTAVLSSVAVQPPYSIAECHIVQDEDWIDQIPQFIDGEDPSDLTGVLVEIYIRPLYDFETVIKKLSTADGSILFDDAASGLLSLNVSRADVISQIPVGVWEHFCVQSSVENINGSPRRVYRERFRGPLIVHPGRT